MKRKILFKIISVVTLLACGMGFAACETENAGLSAFEIYQKYHPEYTGTEGEWIEELNTNSCHHEYSQWSTILTPTCTSIGYDRCSCRLCGDLEYKFVESTGHVAPDKNEYEPTADNHSYYCLSCGQYITEKHSFRVNDSCEICGYNRTNDDNNIVFVDNFSYQSITNNNGEIIYENKKLFDAFENGKKIILIDFFFTTCGPCVSEHSALMEAYERYSDVVEVISISDYPSDTAEKVSSYKNSMGIPWDVVYDGQKASNGDSLIASYFELYTISAYPTHFIINKRGKIVKMDIGGITDPDVFMEWFDTYTSDEYSS